MKMAEVGLYCDDLSKMGGDDLYRVTKTLEASHVESTNIIVWLEDEEVHALFPISRNTRGHDPCFPRHLRIFLTIYIIHYFGR